MKAQLAKAATSRRVWHATAYLNAAAAIVGALSNLWPTLRGSISLPVWITGVALLAGLNVICHQAQAKGVNQ